MSAFEQGYHAHIEGRHAGENPFILFTDDRREWLCGWMAAYQEKVTGGQLADTKEPK